MSNQLFQFSFFIVVTMVMAAVCATIVMDLAYRYFYKEHAAAERYHARKYGYFYGCVFVAALLCAIAILLLLNSQIKSPGLVLLVFVAEAAIAFAGVGLQYYFRRQDVNSWFEVGCDEN